ncbi:MAG: hypothetical protein KBD16_03535 [Candidatus Pacebacteria bacterium]|nr:hypothetical protein [Candidatus Paceibacterota bacterium]
MPVIELWCLPAGQSEDDLRKLHKAVVAAVVAVRELGLKSQSDMTVLFPPDMMQYGLGEEIIVKIWGLFEKPERTEEVRQRLAEGVGSAVHTLYPRAKVECFVTTFDPNQGFWASRPPVDPFRAFRQLERRLPGVNRDSVGHE